MPFFLNKTITKINTPIIPTMEFKNGELYTRKSLPTGKGGFDKTNIPITEPFAMDIWRLQSGWYWWDGAGKDARRHTMLVPLGQDDPNQPNNAAVSCYSVPCYSPQLGVGGADFVIENMGAFAAFQMLMDDIRDLAEVREGLVPVIDYTGSLPTEAGPVPGLTVNEWVPRPDRWGDRLISL